MHYSVRLRAERNGKVGAAGCRASLEGSRGLVVCKSIGIGASALCGSGLIGIRSSKSRARRLTEEIVELNVLDRAGLRGVEVTRAAVGRVGCTQRMRFDKLGLKDEVLPGFPSKLAMQAEAHPRGKPLGSNGPTSSGGPVKKSVKFSREKCRGPLTLGAKIDRAVSNLAVNTGHNTEID